MAGTCSSDSDFETDLGFKNKSRKVHVNCVHIQCDNDNTEGGSVEKSEPIGNE